MLYKLTLKSELLLTVVSMYYLPLRLTNPHVWIQLKRKELGTQKPAKWPGLQLLQNQKTPAYAKVLSVLLIQWAETEPTDIANAQHSQSIHQAQSIYL